MKRMHIHVGVENLNQSVKFYSVLFGHEPTKLKKDYAKWMLDDPRINFAISTRTEKNQIDHLGIQTDNTEELEEITSRLKKAVLEMEDEGETTCCYSRSSKAWITDPSGIAWETYHTMSDVEVFSERQDSVGCCAPNGNQNQSCC